MNQSAIKSALASLLPKQIILVGYEGDIDMHWAWGSTINKITDSEWFDVCHKIVEHLTLVQLVRWHHYASELHADTSAPWEIHAQAILMACDKWVQPQKIKSLTE